MEPLRVQRAGRGDGRDLVGEDVEREGEEVLAAVVVPGAELLLVGGRALERQAALDFLHLQVDADLLPLLADHLGDLRVLHELPAERHDLDAQPALAVGAQPVALRVLLGQADLVQHLVGFLHVQRGPELPVLRPRVVLVGVHRDHRARRAGAQPERLVDLVTVDPERERAAEVRRVEPLADLRIRVVVQVELDDQVTVVAGVEVDLVVALLLVLEEHGELAEVHVPRGIVVLAGDGAQVDDLEVLGQREHDLVDVG